MTVKSIACDEIFKNCKNMQIKMVICNLQNLLSLKNKVYVFQCQDMNSILWSNFFVKRFISYYSSLELSISR